MSFDFEKNFVPRFEIDYGDVNLKREEKSVVMKMLNNLQNLGPSNSSMQVKFKENNGMLVLEVDIASQIGRFHSAVCDDLLPNLLGQLYADMMDKMSVWKSNRFKSDDRDDNYKLGQ